MQSLSRSKACAEEARAEEPQSSTDSLYTDNLFGNHSEGSAENSGEKVTERLSKSAEEVFHKDLELYKQNENRTLRDY